MFWLSEVSYAYAARDAIFDVVHGGRESREFAAVAGSCITETFPTRQEQEHLQDIIPHLQTGKKTAINSNSQ